MNNFDEENNKCLLFCKKWSIDDVKKILQVYHLEELKEFLPKQPNEKDKIILNSILEKSFDNFYGYMDYQKSKNTFELIMKWREKNK